MGLDHRRADRTADCGALDCRVVIEYEWWKEMGQLATWENILLYSFVPQAIAGSVAFVDAMDRACPGIEDRGHGIAQAAPVLARGNARVARSIALLIGLATIDGWTIIRYYGRTERRDRRFSRLA